MDEDRRAPEVSVVAPVYRNAATLRELLDRLDGALAAESREYVLVVDGSPDESLAVLLAERERRPELVVVELARNFGQHAALCAGFEAARGRVVLVIDADLQQRPEDLPRFLEAWRAGHDFVSGWRTVRGDPLLRKVASKGMNALIRHVTGVTLRDWTCPIAAIDRGIVERVATCGEQRRFLKPAVAQFSRRPTELPVEGVQRAGESGYSLLTLLGVALDFAVSFTTRPFQRLAGLGLVLFGGGAAGGVLYVAARLVGMAPVPRFQLVLFLMLVLGVQVLILGALGEFTHRIYRLVQGQPLFSVRAVHRGGDRGAPA